MKFFIPGINNEQEAEKAYQLIISLAKKATGWEIGNRRIFKIAYLHDGKDRVAEVVKEHGANREVVIAILESNAYLVCTPNRGVRDLPILVGQEEALNIIDFD
jgi:hypothetical protein